MRLFTDPAGVWDARPKPYDRFMDWSTDHEILGFVVFMIGLYGLIAGFAFLMVWIFG